MVVGHYGIDSGGDWWFSVWVWTWEIRLRVGLLRCCGRGLGRKGSIRGRMVVVFGSLLIKQI